ncbi:phosphotransferase [Bacillus sp. B190/17]|uniref:Phosphotransferase n=1 Tax=Bacillus lumedeiriae TaxID=3058829 RepID=A0ABW8I4V1_9BACI
MRTTKHVWFVKRYTSLFQLEKQLKLCRVLKEAGFSQVISFHPASPVRLEKQVFAILPFVQPAKKMFSFQTRMEREEALQLLASFHRQTECVFKSVSAEFPVFDQLSVWHKRLADFQQVFPELSRYFPPSILQRYAEMGAWCLNGLLVRPQKEEKNAIIHGDVAAHNFLRSADGVLYLIDFDLAARAPAMTDYVQWVNRVLPLVDWDLEEIMKHRVVSNYTHKKNWLLYVLFPSDIFRECQRVIHMNAFGKNPIYEHAYDLAVKSFAQREHFFRKWKKEWEKQ